MLLCVCYIEFVRAHNSPFRFVTSKPAPYSPRSMGAHNQARSQAQLNPKYILTWWVRFASPYNLGSPTSRIWGRTKSNILLHHTVGRTGSHIMEMWQVFFFNHMGPDAEYIFGKNMYPHITRSSVTWYLLERRTVWFSLSWQKQSPYQPRTTSSHN
jgi:hypothetical protein